MTISRLSVNATVTVFNNKDQRYIWEMTVTTYKIFRSDIRISVEEVQNFGGGSGAVLFYSKSIVTNTIITMLSQI